MREIKFRAWDENKKEMFIIDELSYTTEGSRTLLASQKDFSSQDAIYNRFVLRSGQYPIMQYTGLKDKKGKEIYEGDIFGDYDYETGERIVVGKIIYTAPEFEVVDENNRWTESLEEGKREIIGNIYGNPELLKQQ